MIINNKLDERMGCGVMDTPFDTKMVSLSSGGDNVLDVVWGAPGSHFFPNGTFRVDAAWFCGGW